MKIILAEDRSGKLFGERTFTADTIIVGRDPAACHFFVDQNQWPMVSRKHAEFHLSEGRWLVTDTNSRFGTFVDGQRISAAVEVRVGSHVQLGGGGPILRVVSIEQSSTAETPRPASEFGRRETVSEPDPVRNKVQPDLSTQKISPASPTPSQTTAALELLNSKGN